MSVIRIVIEVDTREEMNAKAVAGEVVMVLNNVVEEGLEELGTFELVEVQEQQWVPL